MSTDYITLSGAPDYSAWVGAALADACAGYDPEAIALALLSEDCDA